MYSHIIQEDIADSTRGRELVETKVRLARIALLSSIGRISLIPNSMDAPVILMHYAILMCTNAHTRQTLISYVHFALCRLRRRNSDKCITASVLRLLFRQIAGINRVFCSQCLHILKCYVTTHLNGNRNC